MEATRLKVSREQMESLGFSKDERVDDERDYGIYYKSIGNRTLFLFFLYEDYIRIWRIKNSRTRLDVIDLDGVSFTFDQMCQYIKENCAEYIWKDILITPSVKYRLRKLSTPHELT